MEKIITGFQVLKTCFGAILEQVNYHFGAAKQCFGAGGFIVWSNEAMFQSKKILFRAGKFYFGVPNIQLFGSIPLFIASFFSLRIMCAFN